MLVAERVVGHRDDPAVVDRLADGHRTVVLSDTERRRSRVRTTTAGGDDLGIVVGDDLGDGDVLEADDGTLVVVELETVDALVLDLGEADLSPTAALELGHALGNRHWRLALRGSEALFPVEDTRERTEAIVEASVPDGVTHRYEAVSPTTFDGVGPAHSHTHSHGVPTLDVGMVSTPRDDDGGES